MMGVVGLKKEWSYQLNCWEAENCPRESETQLAILTEMHTVNSAAAGRREVVAALPRKLLRSTDGSVPFTSVWILAISTFREVSLMCSEETSSVAFYSPLSGQWAQRAAHSSGVRDSFGWWMRWLLSYHKRTKTSVPNHRHHTSDCRFFLTLHKIKPRENFLQKWLNKILI